MDTESVRSGYSERSRRATNRVTHGILQSEGSNVIANPLSSSPYNDLSTNNRLNFINQPNRSLNRNSHHQHHHNNHGDPIYSSKLNSSLSANTPPNNSSTRQPPTISSINDYRRAEEVTVQILPQDDRWADNTTAITGNTSEHSMSIDVDINKLGKTNQWDDNNFYRFKSDVWCVPLYCGIVSICAFLSPIIMLLLPKIDSLDWKVKECGPECDGYLISFIFKLTILLLCSWAVFCHKPRAILPQIHTYRAIIMALLILLIITYWLFYSERIYDRRFNDYELTYENVVQFTVPFVDLLLWIHFAAIILIYWKHKQIYYQAKVIRSPDGESRTYNVGDLCIQTAAVMILDKYYKDFSIYNPYLEVLPVRSERRGKHSRRGGDNHHHFDHHNHSNSNVISNPSTMKYYDLDGLNNHHNHQGNGGVGMSAGILSSSTAQLNSSTSRLVNGDSLIAGDSNDNNNLDDRSSRRGDTRTTSHHHERHSHHHHDRYYEEHEYDRRVRKRKARLLAASEEAFTHIKRIRADEPCPISSPIDPREAAQAIFPAIARSLQKFLRLTRQQPRHTVESIINHLSLCLTYDLSPKAFLEKYFNTRPVLQNDLEKRNMHTWGLISDVPLNRAIESGSVFMLRQDEISLLVSIQAIPYYRIYEEIIDPRCNKFVFKMNSETSV